MTRNILFKSTLYMVLFFLTTGCGGGSKSSSPPGFSKPLDPPVNSNPIIYIAGDYLVNSEEQRGCYWKEKGLKELPGFDGVAKSVTVFNGTVYTAGMYWYGGRFIACFWKGQIVQRLETNTTSAAEAIVHSADGTVYIVGTYYDSELSHHASCYWKVTGETVERIKLPIANGGSDTNIFAAAISGDTVYTLGRYWKDGHFNVCYWEGTKRFDLESIPEAYSIFVSGEDIYIGGWYNNIPCYWKNSERIGLNRDGANNGVVKSIVVSNGTVYCGGLIQDLSDKMVPCYWINKSRTDLTEDWTGITYGEVNSIAVDRSGMVYTAGYIGRTDCKIYPCYWKGITRNDLSEYAGTSYSITIGYEM